MMMSPQKFFAWTALTLTAVIFGGTLYYKWDVLLSYFFAINLTMLLLYFYDKIASPTTVTRVPERVLHAVALCGGSPAAFFGQKFFRHKTSKTAFQIWFWLILLLQIAAIAGYVYYFHMR